METEKLNRLRQQMTSDQLKLNDIAQTEVASSWLSTLPIKELNYSLNKREFFDGLFLRYGWELSNLPLNCACHANFTIQHALSCHIGGYIIRRHNQVRDLTAALLKETCNNVKVEPPLLPLTEDKIDFSKSSNTKNDCKSRHKCRGILAETSNGIL